jgi:hypothetical protein
MLPQNDARAGPTGAGDDPRLERIGRRLEAKNKGRRSGRQVESARREPHALALGRRRDLNREARIQSATIAPPSVKTKQWDRSRQIAYAEGMAAHG